MTQSQPPPEPPVTYEWIPRRVSQVEPERLNLFDTFIKLTDFVTPMGAESVMWDQIPGRGRPDEHGNWIVEVPRPDGTPSNTMFSSHLDTVGWEFKPINRRLGSNGIIETDGRTNLGADDKIGVALMIQMIWRRIPGQYVFHYGEERGGVGSKARANLYQPAHNKCIAFDRRGYQSIITKQMGHQCCSDAFAKALAAALADDDGWIAMEPDPTGSFTDSASYMYLIDECTNLSVGYDNAHTNQEWQDIDWANVLLERLVQVDWEHLPTFRNAGQAKQEREEADRKAEEARRNPLYYPSNRSRDCQVGHEHRMEEFFGDGDSTSSNSGGRRLDAGRFKLIGGEWYKWDDGKNDWIRFDLNEPDTTSAGSVEGKVYGKATKKESKPKLDKRKVCCDCCGKEESVPVELLIDGGKFHLCSFHLRDFEDRFDRDLLSKEEAQYLRHYKFALATRDGHVKQTKSQRRRMRRWRAAAKVSIKKGKGSPIPI